MGVIQCSTDFLGFPLKTPKNDHIWPKPRFSGPESGFGPDVVAFEACRRRIVIIVVAAVVVAAVPSSSVVLCCGSRWDHFWNETLPRTL